MRAELIERASSSSSRWSHVVAIGHVSLRSSSGPERLGHVVPEYRPRPHHWSYAM